jgi:hypothetical protein
MVDDYTHSNAGTGSGPGREPRLARSVVAANVMKAKVFAVPCTSCPLASRRRARWKNN